MKRKIILLTVIFVAVIVTVGITFFLTRPAHRATGPKGTVRAYFHLYFSPAKEYLTSLLEEFETFYPEIRLEYTIEPYQDMRRELLREMDILNASIGERNAEEIEIVSALSGQDLDLAPILLRQVSPWISSGWSLYYDTRRIGELGYTDEELLELSRRGMQAFAETLAPETVDGEYLFGLGANFYWPWLVWVQHLQLLANEGNSPSGYSPEEWQDGIEGWYRLVADGLVNPDYTEMNWAGAQLSIAEGRALFVLSDSTIFSTYPPRERVHINSIPFPGSVQQGWLVGSNFYLGLFSGLEASARPGRTQEHTTDEREKIELGPGALLLNYLHSEGIRGRFLKETGIQLLPAEVENDVREIPSLTQMVRDQEIQELLKYIGRE